MDDPVCKPLQVGPSELEKPSPTGETTAQAALMCRISAAWATHHHFRCRYLGFTRYSKLYPKERGSFNV